MCRRTKEEEEGDRRSRNGKRETKRNGGRWNQKGNFNQVAGMSAQQRGWRRNFSPSLFFLLSNIFSFGISLSLSLSRFRQSTAFLLFFPPPRHSIPIFRAIQTKTARAEFLPFVPSRVKVGAPHHPRLLSARPFFHHTQNCREREREKMFLFFHPSIHP